MEKSVPKSFAKKRMKKWWKRRNRRK